MPWSVITRKDQERTKGVYDWHAHLVTDQRVRIMKLPIATYSADDSAVVGAWVMLEITDTDQTRVQSEGVGTTASWEVQQQAGK